MRSSSGSGPPEKSSGKQARFGGCRVTALSRDPARFASRTPHLATDPAVTLVAGDVRDFPFPDGPVTHVIHAATDSIAPLGAVGPRLMFDVCVEGTRRVLELARQRRAARLLFTSSGAVYGRPPTDLACMPENFSGGPDPLDDRNAYAEGKRAAEMLCGLAARDGLAVTIARCFAFVGPHLPLAAHFAIGNFLRDAITGGPIRVGGDGTPYRSYLYAPDLAEWLVTILLRGVPGRAYNVGSEESLSIRDVADRVADVAATVWPRRGRPEVVMALQPVPGRPAARYVPACGRARAELGLTVSTSLDEAIRRTLLWASATVRCEPS
ncbi:MAG: NAD-dependent epimerase/dehydratase family protein [Planctomycetia bacterium]